MNETLGEYIARLERGGKTLATQCYRRALDHPTSLASAVHARCVQCSGGTDEEGWLDRVRHCRPQGCTLHPVRPYQDGSGQKLSRRKAIDAYCWQCMGGQQGRRSGANGNVRKLIHECPTESCFVHGHRPYQDRRQSLDDGNSVSDALQSACCPHGVENGSRSMVGQGLELSTA